MLLQEFVDRTGFEPTPEEYAEIEDAYYAFNGNKDEFCKVFVANGGEKKVYADRARKIVELRSEMTEMDKNRQCEYSTPGTGNQVAGMYPRVTTHGNVSSEGILVEASQQQHRYMPPMTGDAATGTYPSVAAHGDVADGGFAVGVSDGHAYYSIPACGTRMAKPLAPCAKPPNSGAPARRSLPSTTNCWPICSMRSRWASLERRCKNGLQTHEADHFSRRL